MNGLVVVAKETLNEVQGKPAMINTVKKVEGVKKTVKASGVASKKRKKVG
jgi:hypothetical protein